MSLRCPECKGTGRVPDPRVRCVAIIPDRAYSKGGRCRKRAAYASRCVYHQEKR